VKKTNRTIIFAALLAGVIATPAFAGAEPDYEQVREGHYQAILGDCMGCHTAPGGKAFAGGAALETAYGAFVPPNITPDAATGLGNWSEEQFRRAVKEGIGRGGQRLYPAMPYPNYAKMSDNDVANLWAYMRSVEPVQRNAGRNRLNFPYNYRSLMAVWDGLYLTPGAMKPVAGKSAEWNRGNYLVNGPAHCDTCHTPKSFLGANTSASLAGASLQGWFAPDITADAKHGVGSWSVQDVTAYLKNGHNSHSMASGPMAEAISYSTSKMSDGDLKAIAVYLKDIPASGTDAGTAVAMSDPHMKAGLEIYQDNCAACHGGDGKGENPIFPPLTGNPIVGQTSAETLVRVVLAGTQSVQTKGNITAPSMPSFAYRLNDAQVADMLSYVRGKFAGAGSVSSGMVADERRTLPRH
jgi:mono/diheme cytochrome c family protein